MEKHYFKIYRYCPKELIFDGNMTFTEARRFMDEKATFERRVGFEVFNELTNTWQCFDIAYHGNRRVYDHGELYLLDEDYRNVWKANEQDMYPDCDS